MKRILTTALSGLMVCSFLTVAGAQMNSKDMSSSCPQSSSSSSSSISSPQAGMAGSRYQTPIGKSDARSIMDNFVSSLNNPNLKLGSVTENPNSFEADVMSMDNRMVDHIYVDKNSGAVMDSCMKQSMPQAGMGMGTTNAPTTGSDMGTGSSSDMGTGSSSY